MQLALHPLVQFVAAVIWTPQKYTIFAFSLRLSVSALDWTYLYGELDVLEMVRILSMGPKNSYKCDLTNLLVPLIMLSHNYQNHKQWPRWGHVPYSGASGDRGANGT